MDNSNEQSRLRAISVASTGSAYGEEFFGATRRDRSIDEVCRQLSETTVDCEHATSNESLGTAKVEPFFDPENIDQNFYLIRARASDAGRSLSVTSLNGRNRTSSVGSLNGRNRVSSVGSLSSRSRVSSTFSDILHYLVDDCPSPSTTNEGYSMSSLPSFDLHGEASYDTSLHGQEDGYVRVSSKVAPIGEDLQSVQNQNIQNAAAIAPRKDSGLFASGGSLDAPRKGSVTSAGTFDMLRKGSAASVGSVDVLRKGSAASVGSVDVLRKDSGLFASGGSLDAPRKGSVTSAGTFDMLRKGSAVSHMAARSTRMRRSSSLEVTPCVSGNEVSISGLSVGSNSSGGRACEASEGKHLFAAAMNPPAANESNFRSNAVSHNVAPSVQASPAWMETSDNNAGLHMKRSRSASSANPLMLATDKKIRAGSSTSADLLSMSAPHLAQSLFGNQVLPLPVAQIPNTAFALHPGGPTSNRLGRWTKDEQLRLRMAMQKYGPDPKWRDVAAFVGTRTGPQCSQHWQRNLAPNIAPRRRGAWIPDEDNILRKLIDQFGSSGPWPRIANMMLQSGYQRTDKQCRERWQHHLDPSLRVGSFSEQEDETLMRTFRECGKKWNWKRMKVALAGRTRDQVKRRLKTLQKRMGSKPV